MARSWEGFVIVKSDVDRSESFKVYAFMAEEKSSGFSAELGSNSNAEDPSLRLEGDTPSQWQLPQTKTKAESSS